VTHAFLPLLCPAEHPRIVNVSSGAGSFQSILLPGTVESAVTLPVYPATGRHVPPRRTGPRPPPDPVNQRAFGMLGRAAKPAARQQRPQHRPLRVRQARPLRHH